MRVLNSEKTPARPGRLVGRAPTMSCVAASSAGSPRPRLSWTIILKPPALPMPRTGGGGDDDDEGLLDRAQPRAQIGQDAIGAEGPWRRAPSNGVERREDGAGVRRVGEGGAVEAGERHGMRDARRLEDDLGRLADHRVGARQRGAGRQLDDGDQIALVLLRDEAGRRALELPAGERDQPGIDDEAPARRDAHEPPGQRAIAVRQPVEAAVEAVGRRHAIGRISSDPRARAAPDAA